MKTSKKIVIGIGVLAYLYWTYIFWVFLFCDISAVFICKRASILIIPVCSFIFIKYKEGE